LAGSASEAGIITSRLDPMGRSWCRNIEGRASAEESGALAKERGF